MFISLTGPVMAGTNPKLRGILLFLQFGLCKAIRVVFTMLTNLSTFPCLPGGMFLFGIENTISYTKWASFRT